MLRIPLGLPPLDLAPKGSGRTEALAQGQFYPDRLVVISRHMYPKWLRLWRAFLERLHVMTTSDNADHTTLVTTISVDSASQLTGAGEIGAFMFSPASVGVQTTFAGGSRFLVEFRNESRHKVLVTACFIGRSSLRFSGEEDEDGL